MKKMIIPALLCCFISACGESSNKGDNMDTTVKTIYLKSRVSDRELAVKLPDCAIISTFREGLKENKDKKLVYGIDMQFERLAFSQSEFNARCGTKQDNKGADLYAIDPFSERLNLLKTDPFAYLVKERTPLDSKPVGEKNNMKLYVISPVADGVFIDKNFLDGSRPIMIDFVRFNPKTPNSSFRHYFDIETILAGEYRLTYTVVADNKNPSHFAEKLRRLIEQNQNVLDYPDVIKGFVLHNEKVADFFEGKAPVGD